MQSIWRLVLAHERSACVSKSEFHACPREVSGAATRLTCCHSPHNVEGTLRLARARERSAFVSRGAVYACIWKAATRLP